jgi:hypothetical protein
MGLPLTEAASLPEDAASSAHTGPVRRQMATAAMINRFVPWEHNRILILLSKTLDLLKKIDTFHGMATNCFLSQERVGRTRRDS